MNKIYNINERPYYSTKKKDEKILIFPLTTRAIEELEFAKNTLKEITNFVNSPEINVNKKINEEMYDLIKSFENKNNYLILNQKHLKTLDEILQNFFVSEKINEKIQSDIPKEIRIYYKISKYFIDSFLKI